LRSLILSIAYPVMPPRAAKQGMPLTYGSAFKKAEASCKVMPVFRANAYPIAAPPRVPRAVTTGFTLSFNTLTTLLLLYWSRKYIKMSLLSSNHGVGGIAAQKQSFCEPPESSAFRTRTRGFESLMGSEGFEPP